VLAGGNSQIEGIRKAHGGIVHAPAGRLAPHLRRRVALAPTLLPAAKRALQMEQSCRWECTSRAARQSREEIGDV
jgi:hypothetical protein